MLVLTRQPGEKVAIGPDITLEVVLVDGAQTRIGIQAPRHLNIARGELLRAETRDPQADPA